jgi:hypothetical protein
MAAQSLNSDRAIETPAPRRHTLREQLARPVKVIILNGCLQGCLCLLQMIAKN